MNRISTMEENQDRYDYTFQYDFMHDEPEPEEANSCEKDVDGIVTCYISIVKVGMFLFTGALIITIIYILGIIM